MTDNQAIELRKMLDERGIEYAESQDRFRTRFRFNYREACGDYLDEIEIMGACITASKSYLTPDQAITATLGKTCKNIKQDYPSLYECSECNWECTDTYCCDSEFNYCPNCGARVINQQEDTWQTKSQ